MASRLSFVVYRAGKSQMAEELYRATIVTAVLTDLLQLWEQEVGLVAVVRAHRKLPFPGRDVKRCVICSTEALRA